MSKDKVGIDFPKTDEVELLTPAQVRKEFEELASLSSRAHHDSPLRKHITCGIPGASYNYQRMILDIISQTESWITVLRYRNGRIKATAWWLPPQAEPSKWGMLLKLVQILVIYGWRCFWNSFWSVIQVNVILEEAKSKFQKPIIQLSDLAAEEKRKGWGTGLLKPVLEMADENGYIIYLECGNHNLVFYKKFGFEIYKRIPLRDKSVEYYAMVRSPK